MSFIIQKIILQRREKLSILKKILEKTNSIEAKKSIISEIKNQEKDLRYFENMEIAQ